MNNININTDGNKLKEMTELQIKLFEYSDRGFKEFQCKLCPTVCPNRIVGVKTPVLRRLAKELVKSGEHDGFLSSLPHEYFEEDQIHGFIISVLDDYDRVISELKRFLPYVDNWTTCDQMSPRCFEKNKDRLIGEIYGMLGSVHTYTVRFGVCMMMKHYLKADFRSEYAERLSLIHSDDYYVNMVLAWYFATALVYQYDAILPYLAENKLNVWVHNKTIQKARESYRITKEQKEYLRTLKLKK